MIKVTFNCGKQHVEPIEQALVELDALSLVITPADEEEIFDDNLTSWI